MSSTGSFDITPYLLNKNDPAPRQTDTYLPRNRSRAQCHQTFPASVESLLEFEIPSPSLDHDPDMQMLMSPTGSLRCSRQEVLSDTSTFWAKTSGFTLGTDRDSYSSIYDDFNDDLSTEYDDFNPPYSQHLRPTSVLPALQLKYYPGSYKTLYSAPLHSTPSWSSNRSTEHSSYMTTTSPSIDRSKSQQSIDYFAKRSVTPFAVEDLREQLDREVCAYEASDSSIEPRPSTPASSLLPSLSFSSVDTSPSSIRTYASSQEMAPAYGTVEEVDKKIKAPPKRLALDRSQSRVSARARQISSPIPSPKFPDVHSAGAASYHGTLSSRHFIPAPSPAPTLTAVEVSIFDDSEDEDGKISHHVKKIKSAVSLQNLHMKSRARAETLTRTPPPMPSAPVMHADRTSDEVPQRSSISSFKLRNSDESNKSANPAAAMATSSCRLTSNGTAQALNLSTMANHKRAISEVRSRLQVATIQKKLSVRRKRSKTTSFASSSPMLPLSTPISPRAKLTSTTDKGQNRMSRYSCFSDPEETSEADCSNARETQENSNRKKRSTKTSSLAEIRMFFREIFQSQN